jgi:hypothetical protein
MLSGLKLYGAIGAAVVVALFFAWVWRIDSLRATYKQELAACQTNHAQFVADVKSKTELARLADAAHKAEVERNQNKISQESDNEIRARIAAAVAAVHSRVQHTPAQAHSSSSGDPAMPSPAVSAASPAGAGQEAVVPTADLEVCAANTVLAEGWQSWWKEVAAVPR